MQVTSRREQRAERHPAIPGPEDISRHVLPNGLVVLIRENHVSPSVVIEGYLPVGSVHEPSSLAGLASFVASMLMRGTETRTFAQINEEIEAVGASLSFGSGRHSTGFSGQCLSEDLELLIDILADVLQHPVFPLEHVERVRGQRLTALQERENDTRQMAGLAFREMAYPEGHPYRLAMTGYPETIRAITREHLVDFYQRLYSPRGGAIAVVGAVDTARVVDLLASKLGRWQPAVEITANSVAPVPPPNEVRRKVIVMPGKSQTDLMLGAPGLARDNPDYHAAVLANTVLGVFGMMGRLGENVRERQGLAYYAYSALEVDKGPGPWVAIAGVAPANVDRAIASIEEEIARMGSELVPEEELADSQAFLTGSLPLRLETNDGVAGAILDMEWYELGLDYLQRYPQLIYSVTSEQIREVVARYLRPDAYALGIAGPEGE
ncbi:MAG: pitrilysin family protein [Anaerolineae bacterium]|nr:insulinase family protein [Anaerolineae bacterium]MDW8098846.1 pitrilysin family protein [Anaerolineae bacterium]